MLVFFLPLTVALFFFWFHDALHDFTRRAQRVARGPNAALRLKFAGPQTTEDLALIAI